MLQAMAKAAVDLCKATRYAGAGTVEFIVDAESFEYWHVGTGQQIFAWATTLSVLALSLYGALRMGRTR